MNKFGWFMCGIFGSGMGIDMIFSYYHLGSVDQRVALFIFGILGIGLMILTQKDVKEQ